MKTILIAGGSGFLGQELETCFSQKGLKVRILTRTPGRENEVYWDARHLGDWIEAVEWADVLINLTGKSVDCRYTKEHKKTILNSRVESTAVLAKAIQKAGNPPRVWLNASSATIYVHSEGQEMTEDEGIIGDDFSMRVCKAWESVFFKEDLEKTRRVALRTSIVFGEKGGAYPKLLTLAKFGMGGKQGDGTQFVSWIHTIDFCRAIEFVINHPEVVGPINVTAPTPLRNKELMRSIQRKVGRSFGLGQPRWLLELGAAIIGTETELLLKSRNVIPGRLNELGFQFTFPTLQTALKELGD